MSYHVEFTDRALKELKKMDPSVARLITAWVRKHLDGCDNPRVYGRGLTANLSGRWRYRIGDYRMLAEIQDNRLIILALHIGHRRDVYDE